MLYTMKAYDEPQGLIYLLDGSWGGSVDHSSELGCHFGYNSFLDYGAEFMCSQFSPIREIWALSGLTERKSADADWKWGSHQQQASSNNLSTFLVSKDRFDGPMVTVLKSDVIKNDVKVSSESSIVCTASKTQLCSNVERNRPKRVHMIPAVDSNAVSVICPKETAVSCIAKGHAYMSSLPVRNFSSQNESGILTIQGEATRLISSRGLPCEDKLCLASLPCDEKFKPVDNNLLDFHSTPASLTALVPSQSHLCAINPSLFKTKSTISDQFNKWREFDMSDDEEDFDVTEQEIDFLGKALCHAQTRARLAENLAEQTLQERDQLQQLLVRETWTTYTYRQRALALELENRLLKFCRKLELGLCANKENTHVCKSVEPRSKALSKLARNKCSVQNTKDSQGPSSSHGKKGKSRRGVSLSCMVGFAFVLGLSIAGSGILLVWSVDWLFFS
ncbi:hypothetical protein L7F22_065106 [Adiantum nelumboides]|nr:hypothetical protein [Adiantum nelumboides]